MSEEVPFEQAWKSVAARVSTRCGQLTRDAHETQEPPGASCSLIAELDQAGCAYEARLVAAGLQRAAGQLAGSAVRITVGGHSGSGKTSLINMLIGAALLPADELPETRVPRLLQSGEADQVLVRTDDGETEIPCTSEAISGYVSLIGAGGDDRARPREVRDLRVILASHPIPAGATWVDSPGINDVTLTEPAAELARAGDILVWVVNSRQALTLTGQEFLAAHLAQAGPASVVFVVNAFLDAENGQSWTAFVAGRDRYESRITRWVDTGGVPHQVTVTSARAATAQPDGFGGPAVRALFAALSEPDAPRVRSTRLFRAVAEVRQIIAELHARSDAEDERVASAARDTAILEKARAREHNEFTRAVRQEISSVLSRHTDAVKACADSVITTTRSGSLRPASHYSAQLEGALRGVLEAVADQLGTAISGCARQHGHHALTTTGRTELRSLLAPGPAAITGRGSGSSSGGSVAGGSVAGAAVGAAIGVLLGGVGAVPGACIGGFIGAGLGGNSAASKEREAIQTQLTAAGEAAAARLLGAQGAVVAVAKRCCQSAAATPPPSPDTTRRNALRAAAARLETNVLTALTEALNATLVTVAAGRGGSDAADVRRAIMDERDGEPAVGGTHR